jgi:hypothetical protein
LKRGWVDAAEEEEFSGMVIKAATSGVEGGGDVFAETGIVWAGTGEADVRR